MKNKLRKFIVIFLLLILIIGASILFKREDTRFIILHSVEQLFLEKALLSEVDMEEKQLGQLSMEELLQNQQKYDFTFNMGLALINKDNPIHVQMDHNLVEYKNSGIMMDSMLVKPYESLSEAVKDDTENSLFIMSSYRTSEEQKSIHAEDNTIAALPGKSEHETGLALDVYVKYYAGNGFLKSEAGQFVNRNSWRYGFIVRYPLFKKGVTGMTFEPWHIRYVGEPHAEIMYRNKWTLEEYIEELTVGEFYEFNEYMISRQKDGRIFIPEGLIDVIISPDNQGNYIITGRADS